MLQTETVMTFAEAAAKLPRLNGKRIHTSTLWRWARKGIGGIRLETRRIGSRFVTSIEALDRFTKALAEADQATESHSSDKSVTPPSRTELQRELDIERAEATLAEAGI